MVVENGGRISNLEKSNGIQNYQIEALTRTVQELNETVKLLHVDVAQFWGPDGVCTTSRQQFTKRIADNEGRTRANSYWIKVAILLLLPILGLAIKAAITG